MLLATLHFSILCSILEFTVVHGFVDLTDVMDDTEYSLTTAPPSKEFTDDQLQNVLQTEFYSLKDLSTILPNESETSDGISFLEDKMKNILGLDSVSDAQMDARSGHIASLIMSAPILPGKGSGNQLLWNVNTLQIDDMNNIIDSINGTINSDGGTGKEEGYGPPNTTQQWEQYAQQAIQHWVMDHETQLQIDASQLFGTSSNNFNINDSNPGSDSNIQAKEDINMAVHSDGELIQMYLPRTFRNIPVIGSHATASIHQGNLVHFGLEKWGDIDEDFDVRAGLKMELAWEELMTYIGDDKGDYGLNGDVKMTEVEFWCKPELQILTRAQESVADTEPSKTKDGYDGGDDTNNETDDYNSSNNENIASRVEGSNDTYMMFGGTRQRMKQRRMQRSTTSYTTSTNTVRRRFLISEGYSHHLIWRFCPKFSAAQKMEAYVDANTGQIYSFRNKIDFLQVKGSVYPTSNDGVVPDGVLQHLWPMPYMDVTVGNTKYTTDHGGNIPYAGGESVRVKFDGPYVTVVDQCGESELVGSGSGRSIDWGSSERSDCEYLTVLFIVRIP